MKLELMFLNIYFYIAVVLAKECSLFLFSSISTQMIMGGSGSFQSSKSHPGTPSGLLSASSDTSSAKLTLPMRTYNIQTLTLC